LNKHATYGRCKRVSAASEPAERSEPAQRRASDGVGESEGRSPSDNGGGAGSCTRVRKYIPAGIYDAYPLLKCRSRREEAARTAGSQPRKISPFPSGTTGNSQPAKLTSVPHPQADEDGRSQVIRLRERAAYPQLGCFPSFYEVDGPRHASYGTVLPSNLVRPLCSFYCTAPRKRSGYVRPAVAGSKDPAYARPNALPPAASLAPHGGSYEGSLFSSSPPLLAHRRAYRIVIAPTVLSPRYRSNDCPG